MNLAFFRRRNRDRHAIPQPHPVTVPVNVTAAERQRPVIDHGQGDGIEWAPDPQASAEVRTHLWLQRNAQPSHNLKLARAAAVLDRHADYLQGHGSAPELGELIATNRYVAEFLRDQVVIA